MAPSLHGLVVENEPKHPRQVHSPRGDSFFGQPRPGDRRKGVMFAMVSHVQRQPVESPVVRVGSVRSLGDPVVFGDEVVGGRVQPSREPGGQEKVSDRGGWEDPHRGELDEDIAQERGGHGNPGRFREDGTERVREELIR